MRGLRAFIPQKEEEGCGRQSCPCSLHPSSPPASPQVPGVLLPRGVLGSPMSPSGPAALGDPQLLVLRADPGQEEDGNGSAARCEITHSAVCATLVAFPAKGREQLPATALRTVPCLLWHPGLPWLRWDPGSPIRAAEGREPSDFLGTTTKAWSDPIWGTDAHLGITVLALLKSASHPMSAPHPHYRLI